MKVWWKSFFWIALINGALILTSWMLAGHMGLGWGFLLALSINYYLILYSPIDQLCTKDRQELKGHDAWGLAQQTEQLAQRLKVSPPRVYLWESPQIQCFVMSKWPGHHHIGFSEATLKNLNSAERELIIMWALLALKSGKVVNWTYLGLFLNLIFIFLSSLDRILSWMIAKRINKPHGITLWLAAPFLFFLQRLFATQKDYISIDRQLSKYGVPPKLTTEVIKKIHFQNQACPKAGRWAFSHLFFSSQLPKLGFLQLLRMQPHYRKRILALCGSYPV